MTIRQLLSRADALRLRKAGYSFSIIDFDFSNLEWKIQVWGSSGIYDVRIRVKRESRRFFDEEFEDLGPEESWELFKEMRPANKVHVLVSCTCPDFLYGGFAYLGTRYGYSLIRETRPPVKRNPKLKGSVCKHLISVLSDLL